MAAAVFAVFGRTNEDQFLVKRLPESLDSTADKRIEESYSAFFGNPLIYHNCKKGQQMDSKLFWGPKSFFFTQVEKCGKGIFDMLLDHFSMSFVKQMEG